MKFKGVVINLGITAAVGLSVIGASSVWWMFSSYDIIQCAAAGVISVMAAGGIFAGVLEAYATAERRRLARMRRKADAMKRRRRNALVIDYPVYREEDVFIEIPVEEAV